MKLTDIRRYHVKEFVADQTKAGRGAVTVRRLVTLLDHLRQCRQG